jgi:lipoate-protein ligase A
MFDLVIDTKAPATHHMEVDRSLLMRGSLRPSLRFYQWERLSVTTGLFSNVADVLDLDRCRKEHIEVAKRPTGGGVLFHHDDVAMSFFFPAPLKGTVSTYAQRTAASIVQALSWTLGVPAATAAAPSTEACSFCMCQVSSSDIQWDGKKIGGGALRKTRAGLLYQVCLFMTPLPWERIALCLHDSDSVQTMQHVSTSLQDLIGGEVSRQRLQEAIVASCIERGKNEAVGS